MRKLFTILALLTTFSVFAQNNTQRSTNENDILWDMVTDTMESVKNEYRLDVCWYSFIDVNNLNIGKAIHTYKLECLKEGDSETDVSVVLKIRDNIRFGLDLRLEEVKVIFTQKPSLDI